MQIRRYKRGGARGRRKTLEREAGGGGDDCAAKGAAFWVVRIMAPSPASGAAGWDRVGRENDGSWETRVDRKVLARTVGVRACEGRCWGLVTGFPQARKPLVEKKRRARINESLQELRLLLAGTEVRRAGRCPGTAERAGGGHGATLTVSPHPASPLLQVQAKLENAEVLELTVRRVQGALRGWARGEWRQDMRAGTRGAFAHLALAGP